VNDSGILHDKVAFLGNPGISVVLFSLFADKRSLSAVILFISPGSSKGVGLHFTSVTMLSHLCIRLALYNDDVFARPVFNSQKLDPEGSEPVKPQSIGLGVSVYILSPHGVCKLEFGDFILLDPV
jgi:hypothetical protein